ncbi:TetR family transcriptional regulator [Embleya sp. AB8]|uniref:TetR family transcriptional regulator n=1 Tax=Embleya sp. AB8 TaxID=3156304 RepID=UPI003C7405F1
MTGEMGLRERKRLRTLETISDTAIALFLAKGFDAVSVAEVAEAAAVSKPTLFRYFPTKEDLVVHRFADHQDEAARVVRARAGDVAALTALRRHFVAGLDRRDPVTGLNDDPRVVAFHRLVFGTPGLVARLAAYTEAAEAALAEALGGPDPVEARLAAGQIVAVQRILARETWRRIAAGERAAALYPQAVAAAERAFAGLAGGLTRYAR